MLIPAETGKQYRLSQYARPARWAIVHSKHARAALPCSGGDISGTKFREALATEIKGATVEGDVEIDGAFFGGSIRPANLIENRIDRRRAQFQTGKRRVVIVVREREGRMVQLPPKAGDFRLVLNADA